MILLKPFSTIAGLRPCPFQSAEAFIWCGQQHNEIVCVTSLLRARQESPVISVLAVNRQTLSGNFEISSPHLLLTWPHREKFISYFEIVSIINWRSNYERLHKISNEVARMTGQFPSREMLGSINSSYSRRHYHRVSIPSQRYQFCCLRERCRFGPYETKQLVTKIVT